MALVGEIANYDALRDQIVQVLQAGKVRAQRAVEDETLRTYHEIGKMLSDYIQIIKSVQITGHRR